MTRSEYSVLDAIAWIEDIGGQALKTNREIRKVNAERCVARGWAKLICCATMDDDGGMLDPEQWGPGYAFTEEGRKAYTDERKAREP